MAEDKKSGDDIRPVAAIVCIAAGIWLLCEGLSLGGVWRVAGGVVFIVFGLFRGWFLIKEAQASGGWQL